MRWRRRGSEAPEDEPLVFGGSTSPRLTSAIAAELEVPVARSETIRFSDGNLFVRVLDNVRGRHVYHVQSTVFPTNDAFMELLFSIDAFKRASAASVTAVVPYFSYGKGDKKDEPRVSIRARVCADAMEAAGVDRVVAMDLHAPQIQGFFSVPVDDLYAIGHLCAAIRELRLENAVVVTPDAGFVKKARLYAHRLDVPLAIADKVRRGHEERAEVVEVIGEVAGRTAVIVDDFVASGSTLAEAAEELVARGARTVFAAATHAVFSAGTRALLDASPIERLIVTDTIETQPDDGGPKVRSVSVADLFAEAIRRIHSRESISILFESDA